MSTQAPEQCQQLTEYGKPCMRAAEPRLLWWEKPCCTSCYRWREVSGLMGGSTR